MAIGRRVTTIGLTGGIGSGKSTVAAMLEQLGAVVIHADSVGHEVYAPGTAGWHAVTHEFGSDVLNADQTIDRKKLGSVVFNDPGALKRLNAIVHPLIYSEIERRIAALRAAGVVEPIVVEAAILIEANWLPLVDEVWLVSAGKAAVIDRVRRERGLSAQEVAKRIDAQLTDSERRRHASAVIENAGSLEELRKEVAALWESVRTR